MRTRYLTFLQGLSAAFDEQRTDAAKATCDWLERLIARNPANFGHNFIYAEQLRRLSRFEEAIVQYDFVLNRHQGHQIARRGRAIALQKLGRVSEAEAEFKHALWWAGCNEQSQAIFHTSLGEFYLETKRGRRRSIRSNRRKKNFLITSAIIGNREGANWTWQL